jgi:hypothetical protein
MQDPAFASGTVLKSLEEDRFLLLAIYSPHRMPHRGADTFKDLVSPRVLERACWRFMQNGAKTIMGHGSDELAAECVENGIYRNPIPWEIDLGNGQKEIIRQGDWIAGFLLTPPTWAAYKSGQIGAASFEAKTRRIPATEESLARVRLNK